jgi:hypothetical protein
VALWKKRGLHRKRERISGSVGGEWLSRRKSCLTEKVAQWRQGCSVGEELSQ